MNLQKLNRVICFTIGGGLLLPLLLPSAGWTYEGPGSTGANYLTLPVGAKSIAMGEVKAALIGDPFNWISTPGALHYLGGDGLGLFHAEWIVDTRYDNLSYHHRINEKTIISTGFTYTYRPDIQGYDVSGMETEDLKSNNFQALVGLGFSPVKSLTAGVTFKYFREKLDAWSAGGLGIDMGFLYVFKNPDFALGFVAQNLGPDIKFDSMAEPLPMTIRFGASSTVTVMENVSELTFASDLVKPRYESIYLSAGSELEVYNSLAVRVGYCGHENRPGSGLTMGGGVKIKDKIILDYAWTPYGDLGTFHRLSIFYCIR